MLDSIFRFCLENNLIVVLILIFVVAWGAMVAPFDWNLGPIPRDPVPTDAIPDIGENQQIVFTDWPGRSPRDVEDQVTYPLTVSLLGVPKVKTVRSFSYFGFSIIYIIFDERAEFYWTRTRVLEKLQSLPAGTLPPGVQPVLGPDATVLGQVFWYTLEGLDEDGKPTGGWDRDELRSYQDWYVRYALLAAGGVPDVAVIGGYLREYQVDVDPDAMRAANVTIDQIYNAIRNSNIDVGARSIELNMVEYYIRGLGFVKKVSDLENSVVAVNDNVPIALKDVARVWLGPSLKAGTQDKGGAEAVGGVVTMRYRENPLAVIRNVKKKLEELEPGAPARAVIDFTKVSNEEVERFAAGRGFHAFKAGAPDQDAWLAWLRSTPKGERPPWVKLSRVSVVPYYDRTGLIYETLGTLNTAIYAEILVTAIVILVMLRHLKSALLVSITLPLAVLMCFIAMKTFGVDANIVALSGIAIAIGTMVDMGIVLSENIIRHLDEAAPDENRLEVVFRATSEVGSAVMTSVATTIVSFLPVFTMQAAEGKLFRPLAFTKTFALVASLAVALTIIPPFAHVLLAGKGKREKGKGRNERAPGGFPFPFRRFSFLKPLLPERVRRGAAKASNWLVVAGVWLFLTRHWLPLGPERGMIRNAIFVGVVLGGMLLLYEVFHRFYPRLLRWCLNHKPAFLCIPLAMLLAGAMVWQGFGAFFGWLPAGVRRSRPVAAAARAFPGMGKEFMPPLDEGSFLYMPSLMPHTGINQAAAVLQKQNLAIRQIPEIDSVVGKAGRAETPLDPAPYSMIETFVNYQPQYAIDRDSSRLRFRFDPDDTDCFRNMDGRPMPAPDGKPYVVRGRFARDGLGRLIPDKRGNVFRLWRPPLDPALNPGRDAWPGINRPDDIWDEIVRAAETPGIATPPKLQPIITRVIMLQTGMRAAMGVKVFGPDLQTVEAAGLQMEGLLRQVPMIRPGSVLADRIIAKPYFEIEFNRTEIARYGLSIQQVQDVVEMAIGGKPLTTTVEGRERYPVRARYFRELRDSYEALNKIYMPGPNGSHVPLGQVAEIRYVSGPEVIKSEDTFVTSYVIFDKKPQFAEVDVVAAADRFLREKIKSGELHLPPGVTYRFAGNYENQVRAERRLRVVLPVALFLIFLILYLQFRSVPTTLLIFSGIAVAWAGGFLMIWCYAQPWFLDFSVFGVEMRELFQVHTINLSVAIWVGFLALFGIATDDGVLIATYLDESFARTKPATTGEIREATLAGGLRRVRPALMTTATTVLALLPVLSSTGRGSDIMVPMAIPSFGGMTIEVITMLIVPVLYCWVRERRLRGRTE